MRQRLAGLFVIAIALFSASPASANILTGASAVDDCTGFTLTVKGKDLSDPSTVTYSITLQSSSGSNTVQGSINVKPNQNGYFKAHQTRTWASFGIKLNGTYNLSGSATLTSSGSTMQISFSQSQLSCNGNSCTTGASSNFNDNGFSSGDTIWFNSVFNVSGVPSSGAVLSISNATISYYANGSQYSIPVPDANIYFASNVQQATTLFGDEGWDTALPVYALPGNQFAAGVEVPAGSGPPAGTKNIVWSATFSSGTPGLSVNFLWGAAVYTDFSTHYDRVGVKPVDSNQLSKYQNSDHAGTPENYKSALVGGGTGGGGSNYTGSYSGTASCALQPSGDARRRGNAIRWIRR